MGSSANRQPVNKPETEHTKLSATDCAQERPDVEPAGVLRGSRFAWAIGASKPGCWLSRLVARKQREENQALLPVAAFGEVAQSALDRESGSSPTGNRRGSLTREGMTLADLKPGECGYVGQLVGSAQGRLRLLEMGMTPGTHVKVLRAAAFGGPLDVHVRGYQLSLRREEAAAVWLGSAPDSL